MEKQANREVGIYTYYDREAKAYDIPFHTFSDLNAVRKFKIDAENKGSVVSEFTAEFDLYKLGSFDMHTGEHTIKHELLIEGNKLQHLKEK